VRVGDQLGDLVDRRHAGVTRCQLCYPGVAVAGAKRGREGGADLVLAGVVELVRDQGLATEGGAEVGEERGLDGGDRLLPSANSSFDSVFGTMTASIFIGVAGAVPLQRAQTATAATDQRNNGESS
jgi:hypothetical protein